MGAGIAGGTVAVTGATGFVGRSVVRELLSKGYRVRALVRSTTKARSVLPRAQGLELVAGDVLSEGAAAELVQRCAACVHLVGILREAPGGQTFRRMHVEATRAMVRACEEAKVSRFVHMSALGASDLGVCEYQTSKHEAERIVIDSSLGWTIFRPGMIHGIGSEFLDMVKGFASGLEMPFLFLPYFTGGKTDTRIPLGGTNPKDPLVAPVHVDDVAGAFVKSLSLPAAVGEIYNLVGSQTLSWPRVLEMVRDGTGGNHHLHAWGIPAGVASGAAKCAKLVGLGQALPFDEGMPRMASQDSVADMHKARAHLGMEFRGFAESFGEYAEAL